MEELLNYFSNQPEAQQPTLLAAHHYIAGHPGMSGKIRFKIPFYYRKSWVCYLSLTKDGLVEWGFLRGNELSNENGLLDFRGRKQVASIYLNSTEEIQNPAYQEIFQEALLLDDTVPYTVRK